MRVDYENDLERFAVFTIRSKGPHRRQLTDWRIDANRWPDWSGAFPS